MWNREPDVAAAGRRGLRVSNCKLFRGCRWHGHPKPHRSERRHHRRRVVHDPRGFPGWPPRGFRALQLRQAGLQPLRLKLLRDNLRADHRAVFLARHAAQRDPCLQQRPGEPPAVRARGGHPGYGLHAHRVPATGEGQRGLRHLCQRGPDAPLCLPGADQGSARRAVRREWLHHGSVPAGHPGLSLRCR